MWITSVVARAETIQAAACFSRPKTADRINPGARKRKAEASVTSGAMT